MSGEKARCTHAVYAEAAGKRIETRSKDHERSTAQTSLQLQSGGKYLSRRRSQPRQRWTIGT
jgi:hypothetical protein